MALTQKIISLHPKLAGIIDAVVAALLLWWLPRVHTAPQLGLWFGARLAWWVVVLPVMYYPSAQSRLRQWWSLVILHGGLTSLLVLSDARSSLKQMIEVLDVLLPLGSFWLVPAHETALSFAHKPFRRWLLLINTVGLAGLWSALFAAAQVQLIGPAGFKLALFGAVLGIFFISVWWWKNYLAIDYSRLAWIGAVTALLIGEAAYAIALWPLGFLADGFLIAWLWYVLWLLVRFYLSAEGIKWRKQAPFLIANTILMAGYIIFVVRWK